MRYSYRTVRAVPHPMGVTTIGLGIIVHDPLTGQIRAQFRKDKMLLSSYDYEAAIRSTVTALENEIESFNTTQSQVELLPESTLEGMLAIRQAHWNNLVRIDDVRFMDAPDIDSATELLFSVLIGTPRQKQPTLTIPTINRNVRQTYGEFTEVSEAMIIDPTARVSHHDINLNLAIANQDRIFELNSSFNFKLKDTGLLQTTTELWTLKIEKLRQEGGVLRFGDDSSRLVDNVHVVAVFEPPRTREQTEIFDNVSQLWETLDVTALPTGQVKEHAFELQQQLLTA